MPIFLWRQWATYDNEIRNYKRKKSIKYILKVKFCMAKITNNKLKVNSFNHYEKEYKLIK